MSYKKNMYKCSNPKCRPFEDRDRSRDDVFEFLGEMRCVACGRPVKLSASVPAEWLLGIPLVFGVVMVVLLAVSQ